jgi:ActR/RegA family two-component response regulator
MSRVPTTVGLRPKSVLIVEDNLGVQSDLVALVGEAGFRPVTAFRRKDAIALSDRQAFDIALVDKRLVANDHQNQDGLAILRHIHAKNEGTYLILLTGHGEYKDAVQLDDEEVKVHRRMEKARSIPEQSEQIRAALEKGAMHGPPEFRSGSALTIFCGQDVPGNWEVGLRTFLRPDISLTQTSEFLDLLAQTCRPLFERPEDNGIERTSADGVMAGLYWSRGVGGPVVILLARDELPAAVPRLETWPPELQTGEVLYHARRKNLFGAVYQCAGLDYYAFTVPRQ